MIKVVSFLLLILFVLPVLAQNKIIIKDFGKYFKKFDVKGCFVLYDRNKKEYIKYDTARCKESFSPASTFKIPNSLIGLETGVIKDENYVIKWDSIKRWNPDWNMDQDLKTAIKNSTVWYYQESARRVGEEKMQDFINKMDYGNRNISSGIDKFWLGASLKISCDEQIEFLKKFYNESMPFSKRSYEIVKKIILREDSVQYKLRGKTGWAIIDKQNIGWFIGYVETKDNVYFFVTNIETFEASDKFYGSRIEITKLILKELNIL
jgi:beta-lactamase class D